MDEIKEKYVEMLWEMYNKADKRTKSEFEEILNKYDRKVLCAALIITILKIDPAKFNNKEWGGPEDGKKFEQQLKDGGIEDSLIDDCMDDFDAVWYEPQNYLNKWSECFGYLRETQEESQARLCYIKALYDRYNRYT